MGTARAPVAGSGFCPACRERVLKPIWRSGVDSGIPYQFSWVAGQLALGGLLRFPDPRVWIVDGLLL